MPPHRLPQIRFAFKARRNGIHSGRIRRRCFGAAELGVLLPFLLLCAFGCSISRADDAPIVGAWYFPGWTSGAGSQSLLRTRTRAVYNRDDPWGGVRDNAKTAPEPFQRERPLVGSDRHPLIGYYDLADTTTFEAHLKEAASGGLAFFSFYWYWDAHTGDEVIPAEKYLAAAAASSMRLTLTPITLQQAPISRELWEQIITPTLVRHMRSSGYMRAANRPLLPYFRQNFETGYSEAKAIDFLRQSYREAASGDLELAYVLRGTDTDAFAQQVANTVRPDAFTCFLYGPSRPRESYSENVTRWVEHMTRLASNNDGAAAFYPCAGAGFDARPWFDIGWGPWGATSRFTAADQRPYDSDITVAEFARFLRSVQRLLTKRPRGSPIVFIYAWNEWGEGGFIESSQTLGYAYLDTIREVFHLTPRTAKLCPSQGIPGCP